MSENTRKRKPGAGRPKGSNQYGEPTKVVRVPVSMADRVAEYCKHRKLPVYSSTVQAGFPSPADDYIATKLDLREYLVQHPAATFFVRVAGESMRDAGIFEGDLLVVDRSLEPKHGKIVIAAVDGELTVKRLHQRDGQTLLMPENEEFPPIPLSEENSVTIWGVVTSVIHEV